MSLLNTLCGLFLPLKVFKAHRKAKGQLTSVTLHFFRLPLPGVLYPWDLRRRIT